MATTGGANTAVDGLVFGYDTGYPLVSGNSDTYKFNKGEPTVNIRASSGLDGSYSASGRTIDNSGTLIAPDGSTGWSSISSPGSDANYRIAKFTYNSLTGGTTYTFTLELYNPGPNSLEIFVDGTAGYPGTTIPLGYSRWSYTITPNTNKNQAIFFGAENKQANATYSPERLVYYKNYLVEQKSHPTPFTTGTRSVSGSLIDLTRTYDIDLSNVSFDSNAQMEFDGTDDSISNIQVQSSSAMTWEAVVYPEALSKNVFHNGFNPRIAIRSYQINLYHTKPDRNGDVGFTYPFQTGSYYHIVVTYDSSNGYRGYVNGEEKTRTITNNGAAGKPEFNSTAIGLSAGSEGRFDGKIPIAKIYNRTLTASEVLQNYNATKNRFGL